MRAPRLIPLTALAALSIGSPAHAQSTTRLLRTPSVSASHITFAYANNIWVVERAGGSARRLTSFQGQTQNPKLSPDGRLIAFSAEYGGNTDVYTVPVNGGQPTRVTWHPSADLVQGWTPDSRTIVFASTRATAAPSAAPRFWTIAATGGVEQPMPMPRAYQGKISPDGKRVAYRMPSSWDEERRNYRGGQNKPIWILDLTTFALDTTPFTGTKEMDPVWVGEMVYFLSDRDGVSNVWSYDMKSNRLAQATKFTDFDVKSLDAGGGVIVFEQAGYVHELDPATSRSKIVNIAATGDFTWMMAGWKDVTSRVTSLSLSNTGKRAVVEARGEIFTVPAEKGDVRNLTSSGGAADILPLWSPDGRSIAYFSDRGGEYRLYIAGQDGLAAPREIPWPDASRPYAPAWSPNGRKIAFQDSHFQLWIADVAAGTVKVADNDPYFMSDRSLVPVWSPDSKWLVYPKRLKSLYRALYMYDTETGQKRQITDGMADVASPAWDASGKYVWFFASTNVALNTSLLDMSAYDKPPTRSLYMAVLAKADPSPLLPESDDEAARAGAAPRDPGEGTPPRSDSSGTRSGGAGARASDSTTIPAARAGAATRIDFDGIQQRVIAVPDIADRNYASLKAGPPGTVFFLEPAVASGTGGAGGGGGGATLHRYQLSTRRATPFVQGAAQFTVSADGRKLLYRTGGAQGGMYIVDTDRAVPASGAGRMNVTLRAYIDPKDEFRQIFNEGWRNQRNNLYVKNSHGSDWPAVKKMYEPLLAHVMHRADLNYL
ncbi:MAG TPA: protease, partial [Gemmatimonas sp.]|nr:protease [Gemmatimonas sp.]